MGTLPGAFVGSNIGPWYPVVGWSINIEDQYDSVMEAALTTNDNFHASVEVRAEQPESMRAPTENLSQGKIV